VGVVVVVVIVWWFAAAPRLEIELLMSLPQRTGVVVVSPDVRRMMLPSFIPSPAERAPAVRSLFVVLALCSWFFVLSS
jgi:hypothetical protein